MRSGFLEWSVGSMLAVKLMAWVREGPRRENSRSAESIVWAEVGSKRGRGGDGSVIVWVEDTSEIRLTEFPKPWS